MYSRISNAILLLMLSACQGSDGKAEGETIACAIGAGSALAPACQLEWGRDPAGAIVTIRQPDGGFRRLRSVAGVWEAADGAFAADSVTVANGQVEVTVAGDHYLMPGSHAGIDAK
jgi:hypothetical protein